MTTQDQATTPRRWEQTNLLWSKRSLRTESGWTCRVTRPNRLRGQTFVFGTNNFEMAIMLTGWPVLQGDPFYRVTRSRIIYSAELMCLGRKMCVFEEDCANYAPLPIMPHGRRLLTGRERMDSYPAGGRSILWSFWLKCDGKHEQHWFYVKGSCTICSDDVPSGRWQDKY